VKFLDTLLFREVWSPLGVLCYCTLLGQLSKPVGRVRKCYEAKSGRKQETRREFPVKYLRQGDQ
jgi:hypothetical protein